MTSGERYSYGARCRNSLMVLPEEHDAAVMYELSRKARKQRGIASVINHDNFKPPQGTLLAQQ